MSLNISNLLSELQKYYTSSSSSGNKQTTQEEVNTFVSAYGLTGEIRPVSLTADDLEKQIFENGIKVTVSAQNATNFSYKIDSEKNKIIIFGNYLTVTIDEDNADLVEVIGVANEINATSKNDKINIYGYANNVNGLDGDDTVEIYGEENAVDTGDGNDEITVFGDFNELINTEKNIFRGTGAQDVVIGNSKFTISGNPATNNTDDDIATLNINYDSSTEKISFEGDNLMIKTTSDNSDEIELIGNNNYLDTSSGADNISVNGDNNVIEPGLDGIKDVITVSGNNNQISGAQEDEVIYKANEGEITITPDDKAQHSLSITDSAGNIHSYTIENNSSNGETIHISYEITENDEIIFTGSNAKIISQSEDNQFAEIVSLIGDNNYIYLSNGGDELTVYGSGNIIQTGEGMDTVFVNGENNQISGTEEDLVYYTSNSGSVILTPEDKSTHYITIGDFKYRLERNEIVDETDNKNIKFSYELKENGTFELTGNYFKIFEENDTIADNIKVIGNKNYVDTGEGNDRVHIVGNSNIVTAGMGDDDVIVQGNNNDLSGDAGDDSIIIEGENNITDGSFEYENEGKIITLNSDNIGESIEIDGKKYLIQLTEKAETEDKEVTVVVHSRSGVVTIEADDVIVRASSGQEDNIKFVGSNSKIFAADKNDNIEVIGDSNYIDGWSGDDKIKATGRNNSVYGFLGNDEIEIIQRESTEEEIIEEYENVSEKDDDGNERTQEERIKIAYNNLETKFANSADGEFDTNKINASAYTNVAVNMQIFTSEAQTMTLKPTDDEKKIVYGDKTYTVKNYVTADNNNPFIKDRQVKYEFIDVEVSNEDGTTTTQKQLVITGDFISVVADDGQNDLIKVIGGNSYVDLSDEDDILEAEGHHNLIFGGIGSDILKVTGDDNKINSDVKGKESRNDNDTIYVDGDNNTISSGKGSNDRLYVNGKNTVWSDIEYISGNTDSRYSLTNSEREKVITVGNGLKYTIKANIADNQTISGTIPFDYTYVPGTENEPGVLTVIGDKLQIIANSGQADNVVFTGNDCVINLGDGDDIIDASGARNTIYGGLGNDTIKIVGESFSVFGQDGNDKIISNAINSTIDGGTGVNTLNISNRSGANNNIKNIKTINNNPNEGIVVLTTKNSSGEIKYKVDGKEITFTVNPNLQASEKLAGNIYVRYEIVDYEVLDEEGNIIKTVPQLVIDGSNVIIAPPKKTNYQTALYVKLDGANNKLQTSSGDDVITVNGDNNEVLSGEGKNTLTVNGNNNTVQGGSSKDSFNVDGKNNIVIGAGGGDDVNLQGENNIFQITANGATKKGSIVLSKESGAQKIKVFVNGKQRTYRLNLYNIDKAQLDSVSINVQYYIDENGYIVFEAQHVKIEVLDIDVTSTTDEITTDNKDSMKLIGDYCYITGSYGIDAIVVQGNNNVVDGWYGDDSFEVIGDENDIRGFNGNDIINVNGNNNKINGEQGTDTLTILGGEGNSYTSIEKINKNT